MLGPIAKLEMRMDLVLVLSLIGVIFSYFVVHHPILGILLIIAICFLGLLFSRPEIILLISWLAILRFFSTVPWSFGSVKGVFSLRDVALFALLLVMAFRIKSGQVKIRLLKSPVAKALIAFMTVAMINALYTCLYWGVSWKPVIREARTYLFYAFYFIALAMISSKKRLNSFIKLFLYLIIVFSILHIIQSLMMGRWLLFKYTASHALSYRISHGLFRLYVKGGVLPGMALLCMFGIYGSSEINMRQRFAFILIMLLFTIETVFTQSRAHMTGLIVGLVATIIFIRGRKGINYHRWKFSSIIFGIGTIIIIFHLVGNEIRFSSVLIGRMTDFLLDIRTGGGTFGYRLYLLSRYFNASIKPHVIFGSGLLHSSLGYLIPGLPTVGMPGPTGLQMVALPSDVDIGTANILIQMGVIGFISWIVLIVSFVKRSSFIYRSLSDGPYKGIVFGIIAYYIGRIFAWTLGTFIIPNEIVQFAIAAAVIELIYYFNNSRNMVKKPI